MARAGFESFLQNLSYCSKDYQKLISFTRNIHYSYFRSYLNEYISTQNLSTLTYRRNQTVGKGVSGSAFSSFFLEYTIYYACNVETSANNNKQGCQKGITAAVSLFSWIVSERMTRQWRECKTLSYSAVLNIAYTTFSLSMISQSVKDPSIC
nr:MAG TPA: hypothetical protein [Bacteriophage sp.]